MKNKKKYPTNLNPLFLRSFENASDSGDVARKSLLVRFLFFICLPPTNCHAYLSKLPNSFCTSINKSGGPKSSNDDLTASIFSESSGNLEESYNRAKTCK